jgi:hypothetical protein
VAKVTGAEAAEKWARRLSSAGPDIQRGIDRVTTAPGEAAVRQQDKMTQNFGESVSSGRWASKTRQVTLESWKASARDKGVARIAQGVQAALPAQGARYDRLLGAVDAAAAKANAMPSTTLEQRLERANTFARTMHQSKGKI